VSVVTPFLIYSMNRTHRQGLEEAKFSKDDWCNLLSISHRYECERARERSIQEINKLDPPVDDVDKIVMAKRFEVKAWLLPACVALVEQEGPLTYAEAKRLGLGMTLLISEAKEEYIQKLRNGSYNLYHPHTWQRIMTTTQLVEKVLDIR
jgi:hypothetical protein